MEAWWQGLSTLNRCFILSALFFTLLFIWQLISTVADMDADSHGDAGDAAMDHGDMVGGADLDHGEVHAHADHTLGGEIAFTVVSVRSILAFCMLFSWAGALYMMGGTPIVLVLVYSALWGIAAMFLVSYTVYKLLQLQETGTASLWSAIGETGTVYLDVPEGGVGEVRVPVSGAISYVKARSADGRPLKAGVKVKVVEIIDDNVVKVEAIIDGEVD